MLLSSRGEGAFIYPRSSSWSQTLPWEQSDPAQTLLFAEARSLCGSCEPTSRNKIFPLRFEGDPGLFLLVLQRLLMHCPLNGPQLKGLRMLRAEPPAVALPELSSLLAARLQIRLFLRGLHRAAGRGDVELALSRLTSRTKGGLWPLPSTWEGRKVWAGKRDGMKIFFSQQFPLLST